MGLAEELSGYFARAEAAAFPAFLDSGSKSTPLNATPYVTSLAALREGSVLFNRTALIELLVVALETLPSLGVRPVAALLGGSAIGPKPDPGDLDGAVFYEAVAAGPPAGTLLRDWQRAGKARGLDLRLMPADGDPLLLIKTVSFFSTFYSHPRRADGNPSGLVLVDCREPQAIARA